MGKKDFDVSEDDINFEAYEDIKPTLQLVRMILLILLVVVMVSMRFDLYSVKVWPILVKWCHGITIYQYALGAYKPIDKILWGQLLLLALSEVTCKVHRNL